MSQVKENRGNVNLDSPGEFRAAREAMLAEMNGIVNAAKTAGRSLTTDETTRFEAIKCKLEGLDRSYKCNEELRRFNAADDEPAGRRVPARNPSIGMDNRDTQRYSIIAAINASVSGNWRKAG